MKKVAKYKIQYFAHVTHAGELALTVTEGRKLASLGNREGSGWTM